MDIKSDILGEIEAYIRKSKMPPTAFGLQVANDGHLVRDLRDGRNISMKLAKKITIFMENNPPNSKNDNGRQQDEAA